MPVYVGFSLPFSFTSPLIYNLQNFFQFYTSTLSWRKQREHERMNMMSALSFTAMLQILTKVSGWGHLSAEWPHYSEGHHSSVTPQPEWAVCHAPEESQNRQTETGEISQLDNSAPPAEKKSGLAVHSFPLWLMWMEPLFPCKVFSSYVAQILARAKASLFVYEWTT